MPALSKLWRAVVAALASLLVVVLGVVPAHAEEATTSASVFIKDDSFSTNKVNFVVSGNNISGKTLKAIKVANYTQVQVDQYPNPTKIVGYDVTDAGLAARIDAAITAAKIDTTNTVQPGVVYSKTNPMPWVIANLKNSTKSPWAGTLRDLLTQLGADSNFTGATGTSLSAGEKDTSITFTLDPGIYVFVETTATLSTDEPYSSLSIPMMNGSAIKVNNLDETGEPLTPATSDVTQLVTDSGTFDLSTAEYKGTVPTVEKKIVDGSTETDSTSQAIGQEVTFKLKTIVPNWTGYTKYQLFLTDTLSAGLTFKEISSVKLPAYTSGTTTLAEVDLTGSNVAKGYGADWTLEPTSPTSLTDFTTVPATGADSSFKIWFAPSAEKGTNSDLVAAAAKTNSPWATANIGRPLEVTYKAVVNRHAIINGTGNPNTVNLTFSNKPNDGTSTEVTPDDTVKVYTGKIDITKTDMSGATLAGAEFEIYQGSTQIKVVKTADGVYRVTDSPLKDTGKDTGEEALTTEGNTPFYTGTLVTPTTGKLVISGLAGNYTIKETKSPYGVADYLLPDFSFKIATGLASEEATSATSTISDFNGNAKLTATGLVSLTDNSVSFTVKNPRSLLDMPKTGSIWLLIYGGAALLCAIAAYFLLFRRRSED